MRIMSLFVLLLLSVSTFAQGDTSFTHVGMPPTKWGNCRLERININLQAVFPSAQAFLRVL